MDYLETLSAQLPPTRQDEPARLRQDILDELNDHLVCAYNRELLRGVDRAVAQRRVLEQFGDPAALARRLWLDAMKGKIMAQRVVIVTCFLVTAASVALVGLFWQQSVRAQQMAARQVAVAQAREQEVLQQLRAMSDAIRHPRSPDWNPVRIKLTEETADGPPVANASIKLIRSHENPPKTIRRESDASGLADFGLVQPGDYRYQITKDWAEGFLSTSGELNVQPGNDVTKSIVCPKAPLRVGVRVRWQWPADLEKETLCLYAPFRIRSRELGSGNRWTIHRSTAREVALRKRIQNQTEMRQFPWPTLRHSVLCGPSTKIIEFLDLNVPNFWTLNEAAIQKADASKLESGEWADVLEEDIRELKDPSATIEMETGRYVLSELFVLRPSQAPDLGPGQRRYELILVASARIADRTISQFSRPPDVKNLQQMSGKILEPHPSRLTPLELPREYWLELSKAFEARSGQPNEWTIPIPDVLAQPVREALKADKAPKAKPAEKSEAVKGKG